MDTWIEMDSGGRPGWADAGEHGSWCTSLTLPRSLRWRSGIPCLLGWDGYAGTWIGAELVFMAEAAWADKMRLWEDCLVFVFRLYVLICINGCPVAAVSKVVREPRWWVTAVSWCGGHAGAMFLCIEVIVVAKVS